jgi:bifunctional NMN adenylyltransferase/nudix hydrolase
MTPEAAAIFKMGSGSLSITPQVSTSPTSPTSPTSTTDSVRSHSKPYDLAVIVGRFEPLHAGHGILLNKAVMVADKVLVLIGSSFLPRTIKNPFTYKERAFMIREYCAQHKVLLDRVATAPLRDYLYSDAAWEKQVQDLVAQHLSEEFKGESVRPLTVAIVGHKKDESSYYLDRFPQWSFIDVEEFHLPGLDATNVRNLLFSNKGNLELLHGVLPDSTFNLLQKFVDSPDYERLVREYTALKAYKASWSAAPYPPVFVTVDAVVSKSGHILMVKRKTAPGEGLWALPGGFINIGEKLFDSCLREVYEETHIDLPPAVLKGALTKIEVFDHPQRSLRGRTVTHAHLFQLDGRDSKPGLPKVRGDDDAAEAKWIPLSELIQMSEIVFEDHLDVVRKLLVV